MSNRKKIIAHLKANGLSTFDELELATDIERKVLRYSINDAKKVGHVTVEKDHFTGQPAYKITDTGEKWLKEQPASDSPAEKLASEIKAAAQEEIPAAKADDSRVKDLESQLAEWQRVASTISASTPGEVEKHIAFLDSELVQAKQETADSVAKLAEAEEQAFDAYVQAPVMVGYAVAKPGERMRRYTKAATAQNLAKSYARTYNTSVEVFALVPIGKAKAAAVWEPKA